MKIINVYPKNEDEKNILISFLNHSGYLYNIDALNSDALNELTDRKASFLTGKTSARPWEEIKKKYEKR